MNVNGCEYRRPRTSRLEQINSSKNFKFHSRKPDTSNLQDLNSYAQSILYEKPDCRVTTPFSYTNDNSNMIFPLVVQKLDRPSVSRASTAKTKFMTKSRLSRPTTAATSQRIYAEKYQHLVLATRPNSCISQKSRPHTAVNPQTKNLITLERGFRYENIHRIFPPLDQSFDSNFSRSLYLQKQLERTNPHHFIKKDSTFHNIKDFEKRILYNKHGDYIPIKMQDRSVLENSPTATNLIGYDLHGKVRVQLSGKCFLAVGGMILYRGEGFKEFIQTARGSIGWDILVIFLEMVEEFVDKYNCKLELR
jgi:hypothetical protein